MGEQTLSYFCSEMKLRKNVVRADIRELTYLWERTTPDNSSIKPGIIFLNLMALTRAYMRGRNCRMGNLQGYERYSFLDTYLILLVIEDAIERGWFWYPYLHRAGFTSMENILSMIKPLVFKKPEEAELPEKPEYDILKEIERMLEEKGGWQG